MHRRDLNNYDLHLQWTLEEFYSRTNDWPKAQEELVNTFRRSVGDVNRLLASGEFDEDVVARIPAIIEAQSTVGGDLSRNAIDTIAYRIREDLGISEDVELEPITDVARSELTGQSEGLPTAET